MQRRKGAFGARERMPRFGRLDEDRRAGVGERGDRGGVFWVCSVTQETLANRSRVKSVQFLGALGLDIPFSPPNTAQLREKHAYYGFQGPLYLVDPCRLGLFLAYCAKGSKRANMFPSFSSFPPDSVLPPRVLDYLLRFHSLLPKGVPVFQVSSVVENIGNVQRKFHDVIGRMRCGPARRWVQTQLAVRKAGSKRWLRFFNGKRAFGTFDPRIPGTGRMSNLPMRCRCAACGPRRESGDYRCNTRGPA